MVRLTISVDPPPLRSAFCDFFCFETDFTQKKVIFIQLIESPILPFCLFLLCQKLVG